MVKFSVIYSFNIQQLAKLTRENNQLKEYTTL